MRMCGLIQMFECVYGNIHKSNTGSIDSSIKNIYNL